VVGEPIFAKSVRNNFMKLKSLQLKDFRSYKNRSFDFPNNTTIFIGPNAIGKSNILEAITLLAIGKSFRTGKDEEMIAFDKEFSRVSGDIGGESLEVVLTHGIWQGKKVAKKRFLLNGTGKRRKDFISNLRVVLFEPQDLQLIIGSPARKRNYLDFLLSQVDREYDRSLLAYQKGVRQRNKVLHSINEGRAKTNQLEFWNQLLIKNGEIIRKKREIYIDFLNQFLADKSLDIDTKVKKNLPVIFIKYEPNAITTQRLQKYQQAEIATGNTLIGPHRDNFLIFQKNGYKNRDLDTYGSRGEQRLAVLAMKLTELEYIFEKTKERPLLLLDDIFSELDHDHQELVLAIVNKQQTIITTTSLEFVSRKNNIEIVTLGT
jgi:DNA replication and repair protein RecF